MRFSGALDAGDEQGLTPDAWDSSRAGAYAANFVAVALVGPIVEELMYRGAGMTLLAPYGSTVAVLVTASASGSDTGSSSHSPPSSGSASSSPAPAEDGQRLSVIARPLRVQRDQPGPGRQRPEQCDSASLTMSGPDATDPRIRAAPRRALGQRLKIVEAVNVRLELVARLKRVKEERGLDFLDPAREEWLLQHLADANAGPLTAEGLRELHAELLA